MDETEVVKTLSDLDVKSLGIITTIGLAVFSVYKKFNVVMKILNSLWEETVFNSYNSNLRFITQKHTTYIFKTAYLKSNSQEIFQTMKSIYDVNSQVNIDLKIISFKMYELPDNSVLFANICRFLDYYKSRNGVIINIYLHESSITKTNPTNQIFDLKTYIEKAKIYGVKIISRKDESNG